MHTIRFEQILKTCSEDSKKLGRGLFNYNLSSESLKNTFTGLKYPQNCLLFLPTSFSDNHGQKPWDTFAFLGRFPIHTGPTLPSPHKQCCTCVPRINVACIVDTFFSTSCNIASLSETTAAFSHWVQDWSDRRKSQCRA